jgi:hypothetical protein
MNILKRFFSNEKSENYNLKSNNSICLDDYLDKEFINSLYFSSDQLQEDYINNIRKILKETIVNCKIERINFSAYYTENKIDIPFIFEAIKFFDENNGKIKLSKYYTALSVCRHNIIEKLNNKIYDFRFEEELALKAFKSDYRNYARIETLFVLGEAFFKANELKKTRLYFDIIYKDKYNLSDVTISNFHRRIGDIYLYNHEKKEALKWYKSGFELNSKLGVKKLIANLEKE